MFHNITSEFYSLIRGALVILALYHLFIYFFNRKKQYYLFYSLHFFALFVFFLSDATRRHDWLFDYTNFPALLIGFAFYVLFARNLLGTPKKIPEWDRLIVVQAVVLFTCTFIFVGVQHFFGYEIQKKLILVLAPIFTVFALMTYVVLIKIKSPIVKYFIVGSIIFLISANASLLIPVILEETTKKALHVHQKFFLYVGAISEALIFALLIGKQKHIEEEETLRVKEELELMNKEMSDLKMTALQSQMDPHFLYNSLNSINNFVLQNDIEKASDYITKFSRLIREILQKSSSLTIPLREELGILGLYVKLEQMRMNNSFDYLVTVDYNIDLDDIHVPPLFIQPYIENAIWHGFVNKATDHKISLSLTEDDDKIICTIIDNGVGIDNSKKAKKTESKARKSFGLKTSENRIKLLHENEKVYVIIEDLTETGKAGTKVTVKFPKKSLSHS